MNRRILGSVARIPRPGSRLANLHQGASFRAFTHQQADAWITWVHWPLNHQDKADFVNVIVAKKTVYKSIELSKQTVAIAGNDAIVRHAWESESGTGDGKWNVSKIGVLQVWQKQGTNWRLLARQAFKA